MKKANKTISFALSVLLAFSVCITAGAYNEKSEQQLKFGEDGKFRIMIFTDIHFDGNKNAVTTTIMEEALDKCSPDLVVLLGDNTIADTMAEHEKLFAELTKPITDRSIPFAAILGNHDNSGEDVTPEALIKMYQSYGSLVYDAEPELYGCGNCNLPVYSSDGTGTRFNLWFFDSGEKDPDDDDAYDYIRDDQLDWYVKTEKALTEQNGGEPLPSMVFQHIPVADVIDRLFYPFPVYVSYETSMICDGKTYSIIPKGLNYTGMLFERVSSPNYTTDELKLFRENGKVLAGFSGHDHVNSYKVNIDGIDWISVATVHNKNYSNDSNRGAGLITLDENDLTNYEYENIKACDLALEKDSKICSVEGSTNKATYFIVSKFMKVFEPIQEFIYNGADFFRGLFKR